MLSSANATMKTLPINRNRTVFTPTDSQDEQTNPAPVTMQRRSSFQAATKLNSLDFYNPSEPFYFLDKQLIKPTQRNHYSSEQDKRRNTLIVENQMLTSGYSNRTNSFNDQSVHEMNSTEENKNFILTHENHYRDDGIFV
jgi:hypothetical protein